MLGPGVRGIQYTGAFSIRPQQRGSLRHDERQLHPRSLVVLAQCGGGADEVDCAQQRITLKNLGRRPEDGD